MSAAFHCPRCGKYSSARRACRCTRARVALPPTAPPPATRPGALQDQSQYGGQAGPASIDAAYARFLARARPAAPDEAALTGMEETAEEPAVMAAIRDGQMPLVMTAREILEHYQPLDNDRLYWYEDGRGSPDHDETTEEFWARKLRETQINERRNRFPTVVPGEDSPIPPAPTRTAPGFAHPEPSRYPTEGHPSLYEDLRSNGVQSPVSLQADPSRHGEDGKPEILGGHHRLAAIADIDPDAPVPVEFFDTLDQAKGSLGERY